MSKRKARNAIGFKHEDQIPSPTECLSSVGNFDTSIPAEYIPNGQFDPLRVPTHEDDWLAQYEPDNQTYAKWHSRFVTYKDTIVSKKIIYLLPIGKKGQVEELPSLALLAEFCTAFFLGLEVRIMDPIFIEVRAKDSHIIHWKPEGKRAKTFRLLPRHSHSYDKHKMDKDHVQYSVHPMMNLCGAIFPADARCIVGVTMEDLYSDTTDSFTVGMASGPLSGVAVFSFARYDPHFYTKHTNLPPPTSAKKRKGAKKVEEDNVKVLLERSCKVLSHEIGHMMGIAHCTYYECLMNGSGHLEEDFRQPLVLCPVDLRKLMTTLGTNALERYKGLLAFYEKVGFHEVGNWMRKRIEFLEERGTTTSTTSVASEKEVIVLD